MSKSTSILLIGTVVVAAGAAVLLVRSRNALPAPGSETYKQVTRAFYRGLASLEVGLLDDAKREFTTVTTQVEEEPAAWANLGLAHLRLGELDAAAVPIGRALKLAPGNADLVLLAGRMEISSGRIDEGLVHLRRAVELAPDALRPRFALAEQVESSGTADADAQTLALMDELVKLAPQNIAVLVERARIAARVPDLPRLNDSITRLKPMAGNWPAEAVKQYQALQEALAANDLAAAPSTATFLKNVLAPVPAFGEDLAAVRTSPELIAEPIERFLALTPPSAVPAEPDLTLTFSEEVISKPSAPLLLELILAIPPEQDNGTSSLFLIEFGRITSLTGQRVQTRPASQRTDVVGNPAMAVAADWNNDFKRDIITAALGGVRLLIQQDDGAFVEQTPPDPMAAACGCVGVWPADIEMDGDLDVVVARDAGAPFVLRNNGDGQWTGVAMFEGLRDIYDFAWADIDQDGDPDAVFLDRTGNGSTSLVAFANRQAGDFVRLPSPQTSPVAMTIGDLDSDGAFDVIVLDQSGSLRAFTLRDRQWAVRDVATWPGQSRAARLIAADFDNNGALDVVGTGGDETRLWLSDASHQLRLLDRPIAGTVFPAGDLNADGRIDLLAIAPAQKFLEPPPAGQPPVPDRMPTLERRVLRLLNRGTANYHWKQLRFRAQDTAGDQRINSFGLGGYVEARAGLLFQKQLLTGGPVHVGLGTHSTIDVVRILWPNGVPQAEFGTSVDDVMVVEQRLKGSCPWVFTWDGTRMVFVTDFLWRSPLGLRINAQDTAGVTQTEDWVRLRGDQLVPRGGKYDVRITAELWETHFFDHVSLLAVDHPNDTEIFVDERFSPASPPALAVQALKDLRPVRAWDHRGAEVTADVSARDGKHLSTFTRGRYQGIAEDHFVEIEVGSIGPTSTLVATGWIYPTDSSINVASAQAGIAPRGLSLEAQGKNGSWKVVNADIGFPAGKNKTILIDLKEAAGAQRIRLRTNLEIYWDALQLGLRVTSPVKTTRIPVGNAELRYRGFSHTVSPRGDAPETPEYDRVASTSPRWRDLTGYHTRFGDVRELVEQVDDRYVIMNAGDEMRLHFAEVPPPAVGWRRDFVLIGDGWEKDGDYNTGFSQTVLPLPSHDRPAYGADTTSLELEDDPVYQRHREDWQRYHTRYVTPQRFLRGLKPQ